MIYTPLASLAEKQKMTTRSQSDSFDGAPRACPWYSTKADKKEAVPQEKGNGDLSFRSLEFDGYEIAGVCTLQMNNISIPPGQRSTELKCLKTWKYIMIEPAT